MLRKKNTDERILEAAKTVFHRKGYEGARMQEIADEAGINKALLHYYFRPRKTCWCRVQGCIPGNLYQLLWLLTQMSRLIKNEESDQRYIGFSRRIHIYPVHPCRNEPKPEKIINVFKSPRYRFHLFERMKKPFMTKSWKRRMSGNFYQYSCVVHLSGGCQPMLQNILIFRWAIWSVYWKKEENTSTFIMNTIRKNEKNRNSAIPIVHKIYVMTIRYSNSLRLLRQAEKTYPLARQSGLLEKSSPTEDKKPQ